MTCKRNSITLLSFTRVRSEASNFLHQYSVISVLFAIWCCISMFLLYDRKTTPYAYIHAYTFSDRCHPQLTQPLLLTYDMESDPNVPGGGLKKVYPAAVVTLILQLHLLQHQPALTLVQLHVRPSSKTFLRPVAGLVHTNTPRINTVSKVK